MQDCLKSIEEELVLVFEYRAKRRKEGRVIYGKFLKFRRLLKEARRMRKVMSALQG